MADRKKSRGPAAIAATSGRRDEGRGCGPLSEMDSQTHGLLQQIFFNKPTASEVGAVASNKAVGLHNLQEHIENILEDAVSVDSCKDSLTSDGRLGCSEVLFDNAANVGTFTMEPDRLGLSSLSNFSSARANCCVYSGKWIYELMLGSKGVMQVGWCTINCKFSQEEGVGDTPDSYAYDGNRLLKWNVKTQKYGKIWLTGDVISCAIDCDKGTTTFFRNGKCMGEAFSNVKTGPGFAYFPSISLSMSENLRANFGATPLRVDGYRPLQDPPQVDFVQAQILFEYLENLLPMMVEEEKSRVALPPSKKKDSSLPPLTETRSKRCTLLLIAAHIFTKLAPLMKSAYIVEACLLQFMLKVCDAESSLAEQPYITKLLDTMWTLMQDFELKLCLENLIITLLSAYRFSPITADFKFPKMYLSLTLAIVRHSLTRRHLLASVLFDKIKFPVFLHIKPPDDAGLIEIVPTVWWKAYSKDDDDDDDDDDSTLVSDTPETMSANKDAYMASCDLLRIKINEIERLQVEMLKVLLTHSDQQDGKTSRNLFLEKFKGFLKENTGARQHPINTCPLPVSHCFFHRLIQALRYIWDSARSDCLPYVPSTEAFMPIQEFLGDSKDYFDFQRCGGLMSHLQRTVIDPEVTKLKKGQKSGNVGIVESSIDSSLDRESLPDSTLLQLLDGVVTLYHIATHKQLAKMSTLRDNMKEFVISLQDTEEKLQKCPEEIPDIKEELLRAREVFLEKTAEQARQMAWVIAVIYSKVKQADVAWVLRITLKTVEKATIHQHLFPFLPEFYIDTCINSYNTLKNYFHPTSELGAVEDLEELVKRFAVFLAMHFSDTRIVNTDVRDNIVQSLACFACFPKSMQTLERLPQHIQKSMMQSLIAPYENRSWAQTNWILVRIWKGCGFGYRYTHLPHLVPSKLQPTELGVASLQKPCPSKVFQKLLSEMLLHEHEMAVRFLDTLFNQLNWSFSEFISTMQEIQEVVSRTEARFIDSRQLKICATCFEITVSLLRVVEMIVTIAIPLFTDWSKTSAELLLTRLILLLCQVLSRITTKNGMFESVSSLLLPGMEVVTHYPILAATVGILIQLILKTKGTSQVRTCQVLLAEPGFQLSSLMFLLRDQGDTAGSAKKIFNLSSFSEVSKTEIKDVRMLISYLQHRQSIMSTSKQVLEDDEVCTICYANPISAVFTPCGHKSCRNCISHQMMSKKECFFCLTVVTAVHDLSGKQIITQNPLKHSI